MYYLLRTKRESHICRQVLVPVAYRRHIKDRLVSRKLGARQLDRA